MTTFLPGMEHEQRKPELSQWFTDPKLARSVWLWANRHERAKSVIEPSAGHGALIRPIFENPMECFLVTAVDVDPRCVAVLQQLVHQVSQAQRGLWCAVQQDFLADANWDEPGPNDPFDLCLMNPPYEDGKAEEFILRALGVAKRVVGIFKASIQHGQERFQTLWSRAVVTREVKLARRPSFGIGASGSEGGKTDFVVLEIVDAPIHAASAYERLVRTETWP
jgi:predicted RNA methylase